MGTTWTIGIHKDISQRLKTVCARFERPVYGLLQYIRRILCTTYSVHTHDHSRVQRSTELLIRLLGVQRTDNVIECVVTAYRRRCGRGEGAVNTTNNNNVPYARAGYLITGLCKSRFAN